MNVKFSHKLAIAQRRQQVAELTLEGWTQAAIAEKLSLTQAAISKDLKQIRIAWRESTIRDFDELRSEELARMAMVEREAWLAWRRSQQPAQTATVDGEAGSQKAKRLDHLGRAYHPLLGGEIARYDPSTEKLERLKQTIGGAPPVPELHLADQPSGHPINWDASPDGKTLYCVPMSSNHLIAYDLTATGDTLPGRDLGPLVSTATATDCRAMCVGPTGDVWISVTESSALGISLHHLVSYRPGDKSPRDHGPVAIKNRDYTPFNDASGKPLPYHGGTFETPDGKLTSRHVTLGVCQAKSGSVYVLMLQPYTVLEISPDALK